MSNYFDSDHSEFEPSNPRGHCDSCRYGPTPVIKSQHRDRCGEQIDMCEICYCTLVGTWVGYPDAHDDTKRELGKMIAWGINFLRDTLR